MENQVDFSQRKHFPGSSGAPFDVFLHRVVEIQKLPGVIFAAILLALAVLVKWGNLPLAAALWGFFLLDWLLLGMLPRAGKSFGPPRPTVLFLAAARSLFALLPPIPALIFQGVGTLLVVYGFWIEPHRLTLTRQRLTTPHLPRGSKLKVMHLGDLHVERITGRERRLNRMITETNPDIILFSGDFLNLTYLRDPQAWQDARAILQEWKAPGGVYVVTGSPAVDLEDVIPQLLKDMPMRWLRDERVTARVGDAEIDIIGLTCTHKPFVDAPRLEAIDRENRPRRFTVLVYHTPDLAPEASQCQVDLQVSGHTHGGQVRLPGFGAFFAASLYGKRFESGRYQVGPMTLYTTRGIGLEGQGAPRVRFFCPPEVILWEIEGV